MATRLPKRAVQQTEAGFQKAVVDFARLHGWAVYHVPDSRRATDTGFPDLILRHDTGPIPLIAAELKRDGQEPRPEQERWMQAFRCAGVPCYLWVPSKWDQVVKVLGG